MFGTTEKPPETTTADLIKDGTEQGFMDDVIDPSQTVPVIVDFWAPWCGPCKTLGPALEAAVTAAKGRVRMVKINVDENQALSGQLRIQSIPTVYAFFQGKPVDGFQGAVAPSEIKRFVDKIAAMGPEALRVAGLWAGVDIDPSLATGREVCERLMARGLLVKDTHGSTIRFAPPIVVEPQDLDWAVQQLEEVLDELRP